MLRLCAENGGDPARPGKKDPVDPLVWLSQRPGEPSWPSGFGAGRPGWHIECAAIATHYLGVTFDVQAGGRDLIFPHHEMSAAHARVALDGSREQPFARRYAHSALVRYEGEKMSKSRGNLVFVCRLLEAGHDPMAIRLAIIGHPYRTDWDWTAESLAAAAARLATWRAAVVAAGPAATEPAAGHAAIDHGAGLRVLARIRERLADDLDAPGALAAVDEWAASALACQAAGSGPVVRAAVDALLGVAL
jgi:L-cysteine:1D-myo-inositol 2-amino-2-deoxy-alpha-D-glucopyranoside ligase